jgi:hypothetical protein
MTQLVLQPCASKASKEHFFDTIATPVSWDSLSEYLGPDVSEFVPGEDLQLWGITPGNSQAQYDKLSVGDVVVFTANRQAFYMAKVSHVFENEGLASSLWGRDEKGRTWQYMYALSEGRYIDFSTEALNIALGYKANNNIQGFLVLDSAKSSGAIAELTATPTAQPPTWISDSTVGKHSQKITPSISRESIEDAIQRAKQIGREKFLEEAGAHKEFRYVVVDGQFEIDAKALIIWAHNKSHPEAKIDPSSFDGNRKTVAEPLRELGFFVDDLRADSLIDEAPMGDDPQKYVEIASTLIGSLDITRLTGQRREQGLIRGALGLKPSGSQQCGICGKVLPSGLLVAGHIKKRSDCSPSERVDVANIAMAVCLFGCDVLFEKRYLTVVDGIIHVKLTGEDAADEYLQSLEGKKAPGWTEVRRKYFEWHAAQPKAPL